MVSEDKRGELSGRSTSICGGLGKRGKMGGLWGRQKQGAVDQTALHHSVLFLEEFGLKALHEFLLEPFLTEPLGDHIFNDAQIGLDSLAII